MPVLGHGDPLPRRPCRVVVAGGSGAGKTTVAGRIAAALGVPYVELDSLYHGPGWVPRPEFEADVRAFTAGPAWVTEWQYAKVRAHLAARADLLVWLDLPRRTVMRQVIVRTVVRRWRRVELWNGNLEPPYRSLFTDPEHIVRWAWTSYPRHREHVLRLHAERPELTIVRLRRRAEVARWLAGPLAAAQRAGDDGGAAQADQRQG
jgi:hypothetical protein